MPGRLFPQLLYSAYVTIPSQLGLLGAAWHACYNSVPIFSRTGLVGKSRLVVTPSSFLSLLRLNRGGRHASSVVCRGGRLAPDTAGPMGQRQGGRRVVRQ